MATDLKKRALDAAIDDGARLLGYKTVRGPATYCKIVFGREWRFCMSAYWIWQVSLLLWPASDF